MRLVIPAGAIGSDSPEEVVDFGGLPGEPNAPYHGLEWADSPTYATKLAGYASGRIGIRGRKVNWRLFGKDAPWIYSEILYRLNPDRTVTTRFNTSVDASWEDGVTSGTIQCNNLNLYRATITQELGPGRFVKTYDRKAVLPMEGMVKPFIDSATGLWPEPFTIPSLTAPPP